MGIFDFLKKQAPANAPITPVTSKDEKLGKADLPALSPPPPPGKGNSLFSMPQLPPLNQQVMPAMPELPTLTQPAAKKAALPRIDELPKIGLPFSEIRPMSGAVPAGAPPLPEPVRTMKPEPALHERRTERVPELPPKKPLEKPVEMPSLPDDIPESVEEKHEEPARIQKLLEELSTEDFELPPLHTTAESKTNPELARLRKPGALFMPAARFEDTLAHILATGEGLNALDVHNEKLGTIENKTKEAIDGLMMGLDTIQKTLLTVDEKLFKVN